MDYRNYKNLADTALGKKNAETVFKNGRIVNVFTEEIIQADIAVQDGIIIGIGDYCGDTEIDLTGKYVAPGFIDAHLHLESTMTAPPQLIHSAVKHGTTTFIVDPHEAANVSGLAGIDYILEQTEQVPANVFVMMPSCVPSSPLEDSGAVLKADQMSPYLTHPRVLGLGEVMDYISVTSAEPLMMKKLSLFADHIKDGHAPFLDDKQLTAYALAGIKTDHECSTYEYAMKERRNGMHILIREGSGARNVEAIVKGIVANHTDTSGFSFCTDDKHISEIEKEGHISHNIRKSIALGIKPISAIKMATLGAAQCYSLTHLGAVAPGYQADLVILGDLESVSIEKVYFCGKDAASLEPSIPACPESLKHTVHIAALTAESLRLPLQSETAPVIQMLEGEILTKKLYEKVPVRDGLFVPDSIYNKAVVVERHKRSGKTGIAPVKGFSLSGGAIATSVSHDSHNIIAIGDNDTDILLAIHDLEKKQGGYSVVQNGKVIGTLPLPIMGLMSDDDYETIESTVHHLKSHAHAMGVPEKLDPFITLSFLALNVIPELRVTTYGIYDVLAGHTITP